MKDHSQDVNFSYNASNDKGYPTFDQVGTDVHLSQARGEGLIHTDDDLVGILID